MIEIPLILQQPDFRFILLKAKCKTPLEKGWADDKNYQFNDPKVLNHSGNIGLICQKGLIVVDFDDKKIEDEIFSQLPETYTQHSGSGGKHCFFFVEDEPENLKLDGVDVQAKRKYIVVAGAIHPNGNKYSVFIDVPIAKISFKEIKRLFFKWDKKAQKKLTTISERKHVHDELIRTIKEKISIPSLLNKYNISTELDHTDCPFHSSKSKRCLSFTDELWNCFHCGRGGDIFNLVQEKENMSFIEAKKQFAEQLGLKIKDSNVLNVSDFQDKSKSLEIETPLKKHLPHFDSFRECFCLIGKEYLSLIKLKYYQLCGAALQRKIKYRTIHTDTRVHIACFLRSDKGKSNLQHSSEISAKKAGLQTEEPTTHHPEQLVGKVVPRREKGKEKEYIQNKGYMGSDYVQINETRMLFSSSEQKHQESREIICKATDPMGKAMMRKKMIDHLPNEKLEYPPIASLTLYSQPIVIPQTIASTGFIRRFFPVAILNDNDIKKIYLQRLEGDQKEEYSEEFIEHLNKIKKRVPKFSSGLAQTFADNSHLLITILQIENPYYASLMEQTTLNNLIKISYLLAAIRGSDVTEDIVVLATLDLIEFYLDALVFAQFIKNSKEIPTGEDYTLMLWLYQNNALNEQSKVTVRMLHAKIGETFNYSWNEKAKRYKAAEKKISYYKDKSWIKTKYGGDLEQESAIWISNSLSKKIKSLIDIKQKYDELVNRAKEYESTCPVCYPRDHLTGAAKPSEFIREIDNHTQKTLQNRGDIGDIGSVV